MAGEAILCKATEIELQSWVKGHLLTNGIGHAPWSIYDGDSWKTESGAWVDGMTWTAPSGRAITRLRMTPLGAEIVEVAGDIENVGDPHPTDPGDEAELAALLDAIRERWAAPDRPADGEPAIPGRAADLRKWRAIWDRIMPLVAEGRSNKSIANWLHDHTDLGVEEDTVRKIIAAGEAGKLGT